MAENTYHPPVSTLLTLGDRHEGGAWPDYLAYGLTDVHIPDLIWLALDEDLPWVDAESTEVWAPIHARRALGQLRAQAAIEPLVQLLHKVDEDEDDWISEELPEVLALIGPTAIPALQTFLASTEHGLWARITASGALEEIGKAYPESREACVLVVTEQLRKYQEQDPTLNADLIHTLIELRALEATPLIEAAFATNAVDLSVTGDWEEVQIALGLLSERLTPAPRGGWLPASWTEKLAAFNENSAATLKPDAAITARKAKEDAEHAKKRRTRKLAKQTKQKQMRQKKKKKK